MPPPDIDAITVQASGESPPPPEDHFEFPRGTVIGRYVVLGRLGIGGMGIVYIAYDPELDRKVAVKLVRAGRTKDLGSSGEARTRMIREAQALAKLNHANVVAVHDVGAVGEGVWLAMEFVEGQTLGAWCAHKERHWREVLDVLLLAGRGLEAAHHAGLIHRDFKPDNVMVGSDGRVRVMDLGLARWAGEAEPKPIDTQERLNQDTDVKPELAALMMRVTQAGAMLGTPFYMAPEQFEGKDAGMAADIFAFCVTAWEALYGERPYAGETLLELLANILTGKPRPAPRGKHVPVWIRRILERGLQRSPDTRWSSMRALLAALAHDPRRARTRVFTAAAAVVGMTAISYGVAAMQGAQASTCRGADQELAAVWNPQRQTEVVQAVRATGVAYAESALMVTLGYLNNYAEAWTAAHTGSCEAYQRGVLSATLFDRRMACLRQRRVDLDATATVLTHTTRATVAHLIDTASGVPAVALCEDDARLLADVAPPEDPKLARKVERGREKLARLQAMERSGQFAEAMEDTRALIVEAGQLGYVPYLVETELLFGTLCMQTADHTEAKAHFDAAIRSGIVARTDELVAQAMVQSLFVVSQLGRPREALESAAVTQAFVDRLGRPPVLAAQLHTCLGAVYADLGQLAQAVAEDEAALALLVAHAPDSPLRWATVNNLALTFRQMNRQHDSEQLLRDTLATLERRYTACHPHMEVIRAEYAASELAMGRSVEAFEKFEHALACWGKEYPAFSVVYLADMGTNSLARDDVPEARRKLERAEELAAISPKMTLYNGRISILRADLEMYDNRLSEARRTLETASLHMQYSPTHLGVETRLGLLAHLRHDDIMAEQHLERAKNHLANFYPEDVGLYHFTKAKVMRGARRPRIEVDAEARRAIEAYESAGAVYARHAEEVRRWLAEHDGANASMRPARPARR